MKESQPNNPLHGITLKSILEHQQRFEIPSADGLGASKS